MSNEILINSHLITNHGKSCTYEFVLNDKLCVTECVRVERHENEKVIPIFNPSYDLEGMLFELNHVRVNPRLDNSYIINILTRALNNIGIDVYNAPAPKDIQTCFKPMGEISDNVRFYLTLKNEIVFLSPSKKPKLMLVDAANEG